ncbi:unnamed protein product [Arctogadus glacialis]
MEPPRLCSRPRDAIYSSFIFLRFSASSSSLITVSTLFTSSLQDVEGQGHGYCCCHHDPPTHTGTDNSILKGREGVGCLIQPLTPPVTRLAVNTLLLVSLPRSPPHPPGSPCTTPHHPTQRWIIPRRRTVTRHRLPLAPGPDSLYLKDPTLRPPPTPPDTPAFRSLTPPGSRHSCGLVWFRLAGTQSDFLLRLYPTEHSRGQGVKGLQFSQWKTTDTDTIMEVCAGGCLWGDKAPLQGGDTAGAGSANADPVARQCGSEVEESLGARKGLLKLISVDHSSYNMCILSDPLPPERTLWLLSGLADERLRTVVLTKGFPEEGSLGGPVALLGTAGTAYVSTLDTGNCPLRLLEEEWSGGKPRAEVALTHPRTHSSLKGRAHLPLRPGQR